VKRKVLGGIMKLKIDEFSSGGEIPTRYTCDGADKRPDVSWEEAPSGTKSFALSCIDYDVPKNLRADGIWTHWLVVDIPGDRNRIGGSEPVPGREIENHFGRPQWGGPCPPDRRHRYFFRLYALNVESIPDDITKENYTEMVEKHSIDRAEYMGTYDRKK
jgi:Raf kinase inhibitor-like YbhB/YbcL family protein